MTFRSEVIEKMAALITVAFGLVAALAWNGAIRAIFDSVFGNPEELVPMLVYAIVVTVVAVVVIILIARAADKANPKEVEKGT